MATSNGDAVSDLEKKIIQQTEYYFGDMNLPRDKFLQEEIKKDDGWVPIDTMLKFNRLKRLTTEADTISKALLKSESGLLEVSEDSTKLRRSPEKPLPDNTKERKDDINARSIYAKGFPPESTLDSLLEFFQQYGKTDTIQMRYDKKEKTFKGSVFAVFQTADDTKSFLEQESIKYEDSELIKMAKDQYFKKKTEEAKEQKKNSAAAEEKEKAEKRKAEEEKKIEEQMTKGAILFIKGLPKETGMDEVKTFFGDFGKVAWMEYAKGDEKALLRFHEGEAQAVLDKAKAAGDGKVVINDAELEISVLEGDEEKDYWRKMFRDIADQRQKKKNKNFQNRKRKFGGRPNQQGNRDNDGGPVKKARKTE